MTTAMTTTETAMTTDPAPATHGDDLRIERLDRPADGAPALTWCVEQS